MEGPRTFRWVMVAATACAVCLLVSARAQDAQASTSSSQAAAASSSKNSTQAQYVGSETCKTSNEDIYAGWEKTPHTE